LAKKEIDINKIISEALQKRAETIAEEKEKIAEKEIWAKGSAVAAAQVPAGQLETAPPVPAASGAPAARPSRYISIETRRILCEEFGAKCSIHGCYRKSQIIHHTQRFSLSRNHDPRFMVPLCKEHHAIAHAADVRFWELRAQR
jgi:hypothetical protein